MGTSFYIDAACRSCIGKRSSNEDNFYFNGKKLPRFNMGMKKEVTTQTSTEPFAAFAVFDGMGGALCGEEASYISAKVFFDNMELLNNLIIDEKHLLRCICSSANESIHRIAEQKQLSQIGTTLAALLFVEKEVHVCSVGDSKIFLFRSGKLLQITKDHTDEAFLKSIGVQKKPSLLQYIGIPSDEGMLDPYISKGRVESGDIYLLCTDGVTDCLSIQELYGLIKSGENSGEIVSDACKLLKQKNTQDNATIIAVTIL